MNLFETVKENVSTKEAAEYYGIQIKRNSMACCPFHPDINPSMKVDRRFHCFGCGADGDVIDFTGRLFNLNAKEAAEKLVRDFGLVYDSRSPPNKPIKTIQNKSDEQIYKETELHCYRVLSDYLQLLRKWKVQYAPCSRNELWNSQFTEALSMQCIVENLLDLFLNGNIEEKARWIAEHGKEVIKLEQRISKLTAGVERFCQRDFRTNDAR